jgi:hypothetical protein
VRRLGLLLAVCTAAALALPGLARAAGAVPYGGGPVLHHNRTHLVFWQPSGSGLTFEGGYIPLVERFLTDVALDSHDPGNVLGLSGQYTDSLGAAEYSSVYGGAVLDSDPLPVSGCVEPPTGPPWTDCVSDAQIQSELIRVISSHHLPTGAGDVYFMVTPDGLASCEASGPESCSLGGDAADGFCGYHSSTPDEEILYADIPYNAVSGHCQSENPRPNSSTADPALSTISHELSEMVTDPYGNAWVDQNGQEIGDICITTYGGTLGGSGQSAWNEVVGSGHFYLQEEYSDENDGCRARVDPDRLSFAIQAGRGAGEMALGAHGSDPHGRFVSYAWILGDGGVAAGRLVHHRYRHAGRYRVVLRGTDSAGNYTLFARTITVR